MPYSVLLTEDETPLRGLFSRALVKAGYRVFVADDSERALAIVNEIDGAPFVLLTDIGLRGMNGYELAKAILRTRPSAKIGFITGGFDQHRIGLGKCPDCRCILRKPFTASALARFVAGITTQCACEELTESSRRQDSDFERNCEVADHGLEKTFTSEVHSGLFVVLVTLILVYQLYARHTVN
jgi:DNA-binding response OmpR family regulator